MVVYQLDQKLKQEKKLSDKAIERDNLPSQLLMKKLEL